MNTDIHRLLDEAFSDVAMTPDAQDLKEEIRANLVARVLELEASGRTPGDAAHEAIAELGSISDLLDQTDAATATALGAEQLFARNRVRPKPAFVVRLVFWSLVAAVGIILGVLGATGMLALPAWAVIVLFGVAAAGLGLVVGDALNQETTTNHPMPANRATGYALATFVAAYSLGISGLVALAALPVWTVAFAAVGAIAAIIGFSFLVASQTNRHKAWVRQAHLGSAQVGNRFEEEPETAARFGIYTVVIWLATLAIILIVGFTVSWWWTPVALIAGLAVMMAVLARMMFGQRTER